VIEPTTIARATQSAPLTITHIHRERGDTYFMAQQSHAHHVAHYLFCDERADQTASR
jgi:hypothetical protein